MEAEQEAGLDVKAIIAKGFHEKNVDVVSEDFQYTSNTIVRYIRGFLYRHGIWPISARDNRKIGIELARSGGSIYFSSPHTIYKNLANHPWIAEADIIHLHWLGGFLDYESFFKKVRKPIVWTMHDEYPGLGGFHYSMWRKKATARLMEIDKKFINIKQKAYENACRLNLVAISSMMQLFFQNNELLKSFPSIKIHNGIEPSSFFPIPKNIARTALGIKEDSVVFLFVSYYIEEDRKGLKELISALETLQIKNTLLICLGKFSEVPKASFEIRCEGFVGNNHLQSIFYSAANYFMMPSFQEVFAQTPMEAMACGTPVVAFPCSGARDLINESNGIVCDDFTIESLIRGVEDAMKKDFDSNLIREELLSRFSYDKIAGEYVNFYQSILATKK